MPAVDTVPVVDTPNAEQVSEEQPSNEGQAEAVPEQEPEPERDSRLMLQEWTKRVNKMGEGDEELEKKCRDFVRKRIMKAHTDGNLHSHNWDEEPVPDPEALRAEP